MANEQSVSVWKKKTIPFSFMPSNAEEEACKVDNTSWVKTQELIEIGHPLIFDLNTARHIRKKITQEELTIEKLRIPFSAVFNYILSYWNLELARSLVKENGVSIDLWDITEKSDTKKYEDESFTFRKLSNDEYSLSIVKLIRDRGLGVGDEIGLYWHPSLSKFIFKLFSKVHDSRIRSVLIYMYL